MQLLKSLQSPEQLAIWPIISLIIFLAFFIGLLWWTFNIDKKFIHEMSNMPLHDQSDDVQPTNHL